MSTHATASKHWSESDLAQLTVEKGFRLRGLEVTRLDTFIDAAFAFVLTLLVISFDEIPSSYDELYVAMKRIPSFFMSFVVLMIFWLHHRRWSRWYGFESRFTIFLSLAVIFLILVYVYPLRIIFEAMFWSISDGYFPASFSTRTVEEFSWVFVIYSTGSLITALLFYGLYKASEMSSTSLGLNELELKITKNNMLGWLVLAIFSLASIVLALTMPDPLVPLAGYIYFVFYPFIWSLRKLTNRT